MKNKSKEYIADVRNEAQTLLSNMEFEKQTKEVPYSNRELDEKFKNLDTLVREKHDDQMVKTNEVLVQTKLTNGYVADLKKWKEQSIGAMKAIAVMGVVIVGLLSWSLLQIYDNSTSIAVLKSQVHSLNTH